MYYILSGLNHKPADVSNRKLESKSAIKVINVSSTYNRILEYIFWGGHRLCKNVFFKNTGWIN